MGIKLVSLGKNVLIAVIPILIIKDVLDPTHSDLQFIVQNRS